MEKSEKTSKKKVLIVITKSAPLGGAQRYVLDLAQGLKNQSHEVTVALGGSGPLLDRLMQAGIRVYRIENMQRDMRLSKEWRVLRELIHIMRTEQPDVVHLNSSKAGGLGGVAARLARVPHIIFTGHAWAFNEDRSVIAKFLIYIFTWCTILLSHKTICVSHKTKQDVVHLPLVSQRCEVVHNGTQTRNYLSKTEARNYLRTLMSDDTKTDTLWIGTIAELHPSKGHTYLLQALAKLEVPFFFALIGEGELRTELEKQVEALGLTNSVHFFGYLDEAPQYLTAFDIFVLPSITEALSLSVLEAGRASLPVIASRVGGIPEIITDQKTGLLTRSRSSEDLAQALTTLLHSPSKRTEYGQALAQRVSEEFSIEKMVRKTIEIYEA